jgi:hypothetical protein
LVEFGTHEELMALKGRYNFLYSLQTDALADTPEADNIGNKKDEDNIGDPDKKSEGSPNTSDDEVDKLIVVNGKIDQTKANEVIKHGDINGNGQANGVSSI